MRVIINIKKKECLMAVVCVCHFDKAIAYSGQKFNDEGVKWAIEQGAEKPADARERLAGIKKSQCGQCGPMLCMAFKKR